MLLTELRQLFVVDAGLLFVQERLGKLRPDFVEGAYGGLFLIDKLDQMQTKLRLYRFGRDVADLHGVGGVAKLRHHLLLGEVAQVAALLLRRAGRVFPRSILEGHSRVEIRAHLLHLVLVGDQNMARADGLGNLKVLLILLVVRGDLLVGDGDVFHDRLDCELARDVLPDFVHGLDELRILLHSELGPEQREELHVDQFLENRSAPHLVVVHGRPLGIETADNRGNILLLDLGRSDSSEHSLGISNRGLLFDCRRRRLRLCRFRLRLGRNCDGRQKNKEQQR